MTVLCCIDSAGTVVVRPTVRFAHSHVATMARYSHGTSGRRVAITVYTVTLMALMLLCEFGWAEAKAQPRHKRRHKSMHGQSMQTYFSFLKYLYAILLIPLAGFLLYAILRDPVTPHIAKEVWYRLQEMVTGQKIVLDGQEQDDHEAAATARTARSVRGLNRPHQA